MAALEDPTGDAARKVARWEGHKVAEFKERWRWFDAWLS